MNRVKANELPTTLQCLSSIIGQVAQVFRYGLLRNCDRVIALSHPGDFRLHGRPADADSKPCTEIHRDRGLHNGPCLFCRILEAVIRICA